MTSAEQPAVRYYRTLYGLQQERLCSPVSELIGIIWWLPRRARKESPTGGTVPHTSVGLSSVPRLDVVSYGAHSALENKRADRTWSAELPP